MNQSDHSSMPATAELVLECSGLTREFHEGGRTLEVLKEAELEISAGERIAIVGESGSGKTTLLQLLGGLDLPTRGTVRVQGKDIAGMSGTERGLLRNKALGFVYQFHHLLPEFTAVENVAMPLLVAGIRPADASVRAEELLSRVGLAARLTHKPAELSGGERQRAAVARALVTRPACVLADEPTGNLDRYNAEQVYDLMLELNHELGTSFLIATHDPLIAERMDRIVLLEDGLLIE